jgi:hypothetical protein
MGGKWIPHVSTRRKTPHSISRPRSGKTKFLSCCSPDTARRKPASEVTHENSLDRCRRDWGRYDLTLLCGLWWFGDRDGRERRKRDHELDDLFVEIEWLDDVIEHVDRLDDDIELLGRRSLR